MATAIMQVREPDVQITLSFDEANMLLALLRMHPVLRSTNEADAIALELRGVLTTVIEEINTFQITEAGRE